MAPFGIKDALDIFIVALLLFYLYRIMKESGTINIFFGVLEIGRASCRERVEDRV